MENQNDLLRMISEALQQNKVINDEILRLISMQSGMHDVQLQEIKRLLSINSGTLRLIRENTPTD
jgi:hypothetical protein